MNESYLNNKISWQEYEYKHNEKHSDWFWLLGVVAVVSILTAILAKNFLFAIVLFLGAILAGFYGKRDPKLVNFTLLSDGLKIDDSFYYYKNLESFWVRKDKEEKILIIETDRLFFPHLDIPLGDIDPDRVIDFLKNNSLVEKETAESFVHKIFEFFGF